MLLLLLYYLQLWCLHVCDEVSAVVILILSADIVSGCLRSIKSCSSVCNNMRFSDIRMSEMNYCCCCFYVTWNCGACTSVMKPVLLLLLYNVPATVVLVRLWWNHCCCSSCCCCKNNCYSDTWMLRWIAVVAVFKLPATVVLVRQWWSQCCCCCYIMYLQLWCVYVCDEASAVVWRVLDCHNLPSFVQVTVFA